MMTKKDFELIARVLREQYRRYTLTRSPSEFQLSELVKDTHKAAAIGDTIRMFAAELRATNPRFNAERFVAACIEDGSSAERFIERVLDVGPLDAVNRPEAA